MPGNRGSFVVWPVDPPEKLVTWRSRVVTGNAHVQVCDYVIEPHGLRHRVTPPLGDGGDMKVRILSVLTRIMVMVVIAM